MKILLIAERDEVRDAVHSHLGPQHAEIIRYRNPIKAMDNLDEIEPHVVLFSAQDFPRHWKPFLALLRSIWDKSESVFVLLKVDDFTEDEAAKAQALQVNGVVHENLSNAGELNRLREVLGEYSVLYEGRGESRTPVGEDDGVRLVLTHPVSHRLITGTVLDLSTSGLSFEADNKRVAAGLEQGMRFAGSTLRLGDSIYPIDAKLVRAGAELGVEFEGIPDGGRRELEAVVEKISQRSEGGNGLR